MTDRTDHGPTWSGKAAEWAEDLPRASTLDLPSPLPRVIADRYQLETLVAEGGMSLVYQATQLHLGRQIAVKIMRSETTQRHSEYLERFVTEAATLARVSHPNVVTIHDYGQTEEGDAFIAMEYLYGRLLSDLIGTATPMFLPQAVHIAIQVARAMRAAHQEGALHRDLKPSNVMLVQGADDDDFNHVKVIDFGLARLGEYGAFRGKGLYGSPRYMAPEQIAGESVDPRSDIYALGVMVFAMVAGRTPFEGVTPSEILSSHLKDPVPAMSSVGYGREAGRDLDHFVRRCLEKRPEARYQSMAEAVRELKRVYACLPGQINDLVDAQGVPMRLSPIRAASTTDVDASQSGPILPLSGIYDHEPPSLAGSGLSVAPEAQPITSPSGAALAEPIGATSPAVGVWNTAHPEPVEPNRRLWLPVLLLLLGVVGAALVWWLGEGRTPAEPATAAVVAPPQDIRLELDSDPTAAQVFEEGSLVGVTPLVRTYPGSAKGSKRRFEIKRAGYRTVVRTLELDGKQGGLHISLAAEPTPPPGEQVAAESSPSAAAPKAKAKKRRGKRKKRARRAAPSPEVAPEPAPAPAAEAPAALPPEPPAPALVDAPKPAASEVPLLDDERGATTLGPDDGTPILD